ncbi:uncharacterized protein LOC144178195 isoform X2 [Haemaphysalis longicornis]
MANSTQATELLGWNRGPVLSDRREVKQHSGILIVVLVLNLLFWVVVILWRVYILKRARDQIRRQRRQAAEVFANPSAVSYDGAGTLTTAASRDGAERPFVLATPRNELPPSYDEAIKYPSLEWVNSGCEVLVASSPAVSGTGGPAPVQPLQQQPNRTDGRPPVPPRPSRPPSARPAVHVSASIAPDTTGLPTYEEIQRRATIQSPEIVLTVASHVRNQSA